MLERIVEAHPESDVYVMYDVACTMKKHLEVRMCPYLSLNISYDLTLYKMINKHVLVSIIIIVPE